MPSATLHELKALLATWAPEVRRDRGRIETGVAAVDEVLEGGLARGRVTEIVEAVPSAGCDRLLWSMLGQTRSLRLRVALIDATDSFVPRAYEADLLRHLVWVRARTAKEAVVAADVLVRDGNYAVIVLDLRGVPTRSLRQLSSSVWHRLRLETEQRATAFLVVSSEGFFPAVPWRVVLVQAATLAELSLPRAVRAERMVVEVERARSVSPEERAG